MKESDFKELLKTAQEQLGGESVDIKLFCSKAIVNWWNDREDKEQATAIDTLQVIISRFFVALLQSFFNEGDKIKFRQRCNIALAVLADDITIVNNGMNHAEEFGDDGSMEGGGDNGEEEDPGKQTFH